MKSDFHGKNAAWMSYPALLVLSAGLIWFTSCKKQTHTPLTYESGNISQTQSNARRQAETLPPHSRGEKSLSPNKSNQQLDQLLLSAPSTDQASALEWIIYENAVKNPELACTAFQRLREQHTLNPDVTRFLAAALADFDPDEALLFIQQLPQGPHRKIAVGELCLKIAPTAPAHAADLATLHLPLADGNESIFLRIAEAWAVTDPLAAADWAGRFPEGSARTASIQAILKNWDPSAASSWSSSLADTSLRTEVESILSQNQ